jgi:hypothetical protein
MVVVASASSRDVGSIVRIFHLIFTLDFNTVIKRDDEKCAQKEAQIREKETAVITKTE